MITSTVYRIFALTLCAIALLSANPNTGAAAGLPKGGGVVLEPSDAQGNELTDPGYFEISAAPGSATTLYALVGNVQRRRVGITLTPVDARSGVYGGVSYNLPQQRRKAVGSWISLSRTQVTLSPQKATVVTIEVRVPAKAAPGQYVGGLTAYVPTIRQTKGTNKRDGAVQIQLRRIVAVVVTVPGSSFGQFTIGSVVEKKRPDAYYLVTHIHNTGTILLKGTGHLWVWARGVRKPIVSSKLNIDTTLPHTTVHYPILWSKRPPAKGTYHYSAVVTWNGGKNVKTGAFTVH